MREGPYKVLLVSAHPVQYSAPRYRLMARDPRFDVQVAYCSLQGAEAGVDPEFGVSVQWDVPLLDGYPWVHIPNKSRHPALDRFWGLVNPGLWKLVRQGQFDAVVLYTGYAYASFWITLAAAKLSRVPVLFGTDATSISPRARSNWKASLKKRILPPIFRMATVAIAPSSATAEYLQSLGVSKQRVVVTPFVVDNEYWTRRAAAVDREAVRASWGAKHGEPVVVFCAKLQRWKRPLDVLRAFARVDIKDTRLVLAGDGPMRSDLESEALALGCANRVKFLGFTNQSALPAVYRSADVMVLPSDYDPCPVVVCEAMLCGCPVILSDKIRGRAELVRHRETGYYYPGGDVGALAALLRDVLGDLDRLRRMGEAGRRRMETWTGNDNIEAHYQAIRLSLELTHSA